LKRYHSRIGLGVAILVLIALVLTEVPFPNSGFGGGISGNSTSGCSCHGALADPAVTVTVTGIPTTYSGGQTYALTVEVTGDPLGTDGGFDITVDVGTFSNPGSNAKLENPQEVVHSDANARTWTVDWTAPPEGSGTVSFSAAALTANGDGGSNGDKWTLASYTSLDPSASALEKTIMSLNIPSKANQSDTITLSATLTDKNGDPLESLTVNFYRNSTFGKVFLGQNSTDSQGRASILHMISYAPLNGILQIEAVFNGTSTYEGSQLLKMVVVELEDLPPVPFDFSFLGMILIFVVGAIWLVFGYVVLQIYRIWRAGKVR
jgi:hypothetical protein